MSIYQKLTEIGTKFISKDKLFKYGFNLAPMYRRSTARVIYVSKDLLEVRIKLPISYRNRNFVNTIFGGSMFSAVDPFPMVQLINLLGDEYVVWDKSANISFKRPAKKDLYADFSYTFEELEEIKQRVDLEKEIEIVRTTALTNKEGTKTFCVVEKTLFIADKQHFKNRRTRSK